MLRKVPLRAVFIVPFVLQLLLAVGLVAWLSVNSSERAVEDMTDQLRTEIADRIDEHLKRHMEIPLLVNRINANAIDTGLLDIQDKTSRERYFSRQQQAFPQIAMNFIGTPQGEFMGARRNLAGDIQLVLASDATDHNSHYFSVKPNGEAGELQEVFRNFDPRKRPWYITGEKTGQPGWSEIYRHFVFQDLAITAVHPLYKPSGELIGVLGVDYILTGLNQFLHGLQVGQTGQTFIVCPSGKLVASSGMEKIYSLKDGQMERIPAVDADSPMIRGAARYLENRFGSLHEIQGRQQVAFEQEGERLFAQVLPFREYGLDWRIVVVVPEKDFMGYIQANTRTTYLLIGIALLVAILVGVGTSHWVIRPIRELNIAAGEYGRGNWAYTPAIERDDEVGKLGQSFTAMARQLGELFSQLEQKVAERTRELRKKNVELEAANEKKDLAVKAKSEFLANMSHEIRTPMNAILGFSELLNDHVIDEQGQRYLEYISSNGETLLRIINDILDLSKIEAGKLEIQRRPVHVWELVQEMRRAFATQVEKKGLEFIIEIDPALPARLLLDEVRLRQILFNLIGNAVKFTQRGSIKVTACPVGDRKTGVFDLAVTVEDTGIGIPEGQKQAIFEAFVQQKGQDARYGGTGLGLTITRRLVEMMNGEIALTSEVGRGSAFRVTLRDVERVDAAGPAVARARPARSDVHFTDSLVLVADDEVTNRKLVREYLEPHGIRFIEATDGREVIELAERHRPAAIILDMKMPVMDGFTVMQILKNDEELSTIPVVVVTASVLEDQEAGVRQAGCAAFLRKPVKKEQLLAEVARLLR
ncbi:response regulator [Heliobacterium gestii]|uniref:Circadian input-output histidine kinase CikA n=1 Tax=Heliomicrobium gestii TaxID=2699 RepID=A0A845L6M2_HELGE|nr:hybrid sensor histidine kinase/response regulator [Heliomicrobium gestii]MBM7865618.1 signal transduction histidine kinase [Heliomicrobium gestii]MZP41868.1 response regulator [Heliomicrobium gestii]